MNYIDLNCDMGEGMEYDDQLMPYISSANIACGYHAGNEDIMKKTVELSLQHKVSIGAHPGFLDKANFGRTEMQVSDKQVYDWVTEQLHSLKKICATFNAPIHHIKPHGALYNMAAKNKTLAASIAKAIHDFDTNLFLYGLSGSYLISEAKAIGLQTASEVFADRTYQDTGMLTPRSLPNALIESDDEALLQVLNMVKKQNVTSVTGKIIAITAETICLHGDGKHAVSFAKLIHQSLKNNHIGVKAI
ncbi:5-oxoprolinase subunit PxpA [Chitinophagaceae bacterium LWZ2-11]